MSKAPLPDGINSKLGRVGRKADMNKSMVAAHIVYTIRGCLTQSILWEIVCIHLHRFSNPRLARVLKITDQLFMFRIDANYGQTMP